MKKIWLSHNELSVHGFICKTLLCCLIFLLVNMQSNAQSNSGKVKIFMPNTDEHYTSFYYKKKGAYGETINNMLAIEVEKAFPCAKLLTSDVVGILLSRNKDLALLGVGNESNLEDIVAGAIGADYILSSSFGNDVDEYHWSMQVALLNVRKEKVTARASANAGGDLHNAIDKMIKKIIDQLAEADICPWKGKITVDAIQDEDTGNTTTLTSNTTNGVATTTVKSTNTLKRTEKWEIDAIGKSNGQSIGKGSVNYSEKYNIGTETNTSGDVPCFVNTAPCSIIDNMIPGKFEHVLNYRKGEAAGPKNFDNVMIKVTFAPGTDNYSINILAEEPMAVGEGEEQEYEMWENTCGKCIKKDIKGPFYGTVWASWVLEGQAKRTDNKISGSSNLILGKGITQKINWDLHK